MYKVMVVDDEPEIRRGSFPCNVQRRSAQDSFLYDL